MKIIKNRRGHWSVEAGGDRYASIDLKADYADDAKTVWAYGWHVRLRRKDGWVISRVGCFPRRGPATRAAMDALQPVQ